MFKVRVFKFFIYFNILCIIFLDDFRKEFFIVLFDFRRNRKNRNGIKEIILGVCSFLISDG